MLVLGNLFNLSRINMRGLGFIFEWFYTKIGITNPKNLECKAGDIVKRHLSGQQIIHLFGKLNKAESISV